MKFVFKMLYNTLNMIFYIKKWNMQVHKLFYVNFCLKVIISYV
jgi:hypothetical protein